MALMVGRPEEYPNWGVIGHEWAIRGLARSLSADQVAHAYLFTGPHGIGKTTLAHALAQALECTGSVRPCGECAACRKVARDRHPDVLVIEGVPVGYGSENTEESEEDLPPPPPRKNDRERRILKVWQIRTVRRAIARTPFEGRWKIIILRRFEEANDSASNAFLKSLEEPPRHVRFILTARDASLVLPTIASRCHVLALRPLPLPQVEDALVKRWHVEPSQAHLLARLSGGRLGWAVRAATPETRGVDGHTLLEERRAHLEDLNRVLQIGYAERLTFAGEVAKDKRNKEDLPDLLEAWMGWWRDLVLIQSGQRDRITNVDFEESLSTQARRLSLEEVHAGLKATRATMRYLEQNVNARLAIEVLLLNLPGDRGN